jgi:hypothetical protein
VPHRRKLLGGAVAVGAFGAGAGGALYTQDFGVILGG